MRVLTAFDSATAFNANLSTFDAAYTYLLPHLPVKEQT
jgi:hypothetical protein